MAQLYHYQSYSCKTAITSLKVVLSPATQTAIWPFLRASSPPVMGASSKNAPFSQRALSNSTFWGGRFPFSQLIFHREMEEPSRSTSRFSAEKGPNCLGLPEKVFGGKFKWWGFPQTRAELPWSPGKSVGGKFKWWGWTSWGCISRNLMSLKDFTVHG